MKDPYLYEGSTVLCNLLNIDNEEELNGAEAELSQANMMLLYEQGFSDFSTQGIKTIHKILFEEVYKWAGKFRTINIQKSEPLLAGISVQYSDANNIKTALNSVWKAFDEIKWSSLSREDFAAQIARMFPRLWQVHPFREGNTRSIVMLMTFFVEHYNYYFDKDLLAVSAGYVRNAFVMASLGEYSEFEHLEKILLDAICTEPIEYMDDLDQEESVPLGEKYQKYKTDYKPIAHEYRADEEENSN